MTARARRISVTGDAGADYTDGFELRGVEGEPRSAEQWARDSLEGAPRWLRWIIVFGWRVVLGLRLGPRRSPFHVLGWRLIADSPRQAVLEARSALLTAHLVFDVDDSAVRWTTLVSHRRRASWVIWSVVGLLHRRIVPFALTRAARRSTAAGRPPAR